MSDHEALIHAHPSRWSDVAPCCGRRLVELGAGVLTTTDPKVVTCQGTDTPGSATPGGDDHE